MKRFLTIALVILAVALIWALSSADATTNNKIKVCHQTHSANNPTVTLTISESAWNAHASHGDTKGACPPSEVPVPEEEEPETPPAETPVKETEKPQVTVTQPAPQAQTKAVETPAPYTDLPQFEGK